MTDYRALITMFCRFGSQALLDRLAALTGEIDGVREAKDIEYIHRMRVASRRLRTALDLFAECAPAKHIRKWKNQVGRITRALGAARDADVQIHFLEEAGARAPERRFRPGVERVLLRLKQRREGLQAEVVEALDKFEKRGAAGDMIQTLAASPDDADAPADSQGGPSADSRDFVLCQRAFLAISTKLQELLAYDKYVPQPERVKELHEMRIAAKRLRYTMEIFAPLYGDEFKRLIDTVKSAQEMLGDIHDCDVWADFLPRFLKEEKERAREYTGSARAARRLEPGITYLLNERQYHRGVRYNEFADFWGIHKEADTWGNLLRLLWAGTTPAGPQAKRSEERAASAEARPARATRRKPAHQPVEAKPSLCVALIGDVHANLPALEAVLAHAREQGVEAIWNVGDFVGYGVFPDEAVKLLQGEEALSIAGNYDLKALQVKRRKAKWQKNKHPEKLLAFEWAYDHLSPESRDYLKALPQERRLTAGGKRILLTHGSPDSNEDPLTPDTPEDHLRELARKADADVIICGHSHQPFARRVDGAWFINTGSVGRPDDGDPRACYAVLRLTPESLDVQHHRVEYDAERIADAVREHGLPESFARMFLYGRSLDDLVVEE